MNISVCMAAYNGGLFIKEQLTSILSQLGVNDEIVVVDDCSSDNTLEILSEFRDHRLSVIINDYNKGVVQSFVKALSVARGRYIFLSDQDDVWVNDKINKSLAEMCRLERLYGSDKPLLVHTDLKMVDECLNPLADSFWRQKKFDIDQCQHFPRLLTQNVVTGCTCLLNRPLRDLSLPIPDGAIMHDWWLALVASSHGHIAAIQDQKVLYRQHDRNVLGAQSWLTYVVTRILDNFKADYVRKSIARAIMQAVLFKERYGESLDSQNRQALNVFCNIKSYGFVARRYYVMKYKFLKSGLIRNVALLFFI